MASIAALRVTWQSAKTSRRPVLASRKSLTFLRAFSSDAASSTPTDDAPAAASMAPAAPAKPKSVWGEIFKSDAFARALSAYQSASKAKPAPSEESVAAAKQAAKQARIRVTDEVRKRLDPNSVQSHADTASTQFTLNDDRRIVSMVKRGSTWSDIAKALEKSATSVSTRFRTALDPRLRHDAITTEEDDAIRAHVAEHGTAAWSLLSLKMGYARSPSALRARWIALNAQPRAPAVEWTDEQRMRLVDGVAEHGMNWDAVAAHVGGGHSALACRMLFASTAARTGPVPVVKPFTTDEDARLKEAVALHGRKWSKVAESVPGHTHGRLHARYNALQPAWMRVPFLAKERQAVQDLLTGTGGIIKALRDKFGADEAVARNWVAIMLAMDDASQVNWAVLTKASASRRTHAVEAAAELRSKVAPGDWAAGGDVWVPKWPWPRPLRSGRKAPYVEVLVHPVLSTLVAEGVGDASKGAATKPAAKRAAKGAAKEAAVA